MSDKEKVVKHFEHLLNAAKGNYQDFVDLTVDVGEEILALLKERKTRVMTLEEVVAHYSLPPVVLDDLDWQIEYLSDIKPLYFEYKMAQDHPNHWRNQREAQHCLDHWTELYGKLWRCWTSMPTDEQKKEVKWDGY